jgi:hypothetical protein
MESPFTQLTGLVGPQVTTDGQRSILRTEKDGALVCVDAHGKYAAVNYRNTLFMGNVPVAGAALLVPATTGLHPTLWNPAGSGYIASLVSISITHISGTITIGCPILAYTFNAGSAIGTAAPIVTFTSVVPTPCKIGTQSGRSNMLWAPTTCTFVAAPTFLMGLGMGFFPVTDATAALPINCSVDFDGKLMVPPGTALSVCYNVTTSTALFSTSLVWEEIPL